jgi:hypothetical protein
MTYDSPDTPELEDVIIDSFIFDLQDTFANEARSRYDSKRFFDIYVDTEISGYSTGGKK